MQAPSLSYDFVEEDYDPTGGSHGTACAGIAAASRNDQTCGVGIAYDSNLGGECLLQLTHNIGI